MIELDKLLFFVIFRLKIKLTSYGITLLSNLLNKNDIYLYKLLFLIKFNNNPKIQDMIIMIRHHNIDF